MGLVYFLVGLLLLIAVILILPVRIYTEYNGNLYIKASYAFFSFDIIPTEEEQQQPPEEQQKKPHKAKKKVKTKERKPLSAKDILGYFSLAQELLPSAKTALGFIIRRIVVDKLTLEVVISGDDAAETGINFGKLGVVVYSTLAVVQNIFKVKPPKKINLQPDFVGGQNDVKFSARMSLPTWAAVFAALRLGIKALPAINKIMDKKQPKEATG